MGLRAVDGLAGAGDTWGISGPVFLGLYLLAAVGAAALVALVRRGIAGRKGAPRDLQPYEVAYLMSGKTWAVASALAILRADGAIESAGAGRIRVTDDPSRRTVRTPLVDDLYEEIRGAGDVKTARLTGAHATPTALNRLLLDLEREGLALTDAERAQMRWAVLPLWAMAALGVVRFAAGTAGDRPAVFILIATVLVAIVAVALTAAVPRVTTAGHQALAGARERHRHLDPAQSPAWATYGALGAGFGVALFGSAALVGLDPAFAAESELDRHLGTSGSGGADGGGGGCGDGGGCGGCGGCGG
ncbi:TIGR04222 domain-containing membrane protein [Thermomonospora umbrina]|uniref:Uncharacterized protein (TIGR04222 family) n=1 Tax=Thermomonospora umbrina TaxID=111806 RepID=A0A3D9T4B7_9ACTN|nr:TIGR04222 domain-containing membrane protein [Thermomonospora umbrina]REE99544.1 uncharacterized protein (TIGR04222 family) [Thermomonospora umbrina]